MAVDNKSPLENVALYYAEKLAEHGVTARGVDWNGEEGQQLRFKQLARLIDRKGDFTVNDLGCGYGAFLDYLAPRYEPFHYLGVDVAPEMVVAATKLHGSRQARFQIGNEPDSVADFGFASGIFNVKLDCSNEEWAAHTGATLDVLDGTSKRGFAFNCLTSYSDVDRMQPHLSYVDPGWMLDFCIRRYSRHVSLLHDYGLYEFTVLVRKQL